MARQMAPHAPFTAQKAHAELVAAALETRAAATARAELTPTDDRDEGQRHTNLPPSGISPDWYAQAMKRTLDKYRAAGQLGGGENLSLPTVR